jgi:hypothetical protein
VFKCDALAWVFHHGGRFVRTAVGIDG